MTAVFWPGIHVGFLLVTVINQSEDGEIAQESKDIPKVHGLKLYFPGEYQEAISCLHSKNH